MRKLNNTWVFCESSEALLVSYNQICKFIKNGISTNIYLAFNTFLP